MNFYKFLSTFVGSFLPSWIRIRIRNPDLKLSKFFTGKHHVCRRTGRTCTPSWTTVWSCARWSTSPRPTPSMRGSSTRGSPSPFSRLANNVIAINAPIIYTATCVMLLMRAASITSASRRGLGWALEIDTFLGPHQKHYAHGCQIGIFLLESLVNLRINCIIVRPKFIFKNSKLCTLRQGCGSVFIWYGSIKDVHPSYKRNLQLSNKNIQHFKTWNLQFFQLLWLILPFWIRIRIRTLNTDPVPDPLALLNPDPIRIRIRNPALRKVKPVKNI